MYIQVSISVNILCVQAYTSVHTCQHRLQPKSTSCVYKLCVCTFTTKSKASMDVYVHVSTCAFNPSVNTCAYMSIVNAGPLPSAWCRRYVTWPVSVTQVNIVCTSTTFLCLCIVCMSTKASCTYMSALPSTLACVHMSIINPSPMRCQQ